MAGCYHDQQEFESDWKIEVAREDDILKEGQETKNFKRCKKNPRHEGFISFKDLTLEHLPREIRNKEILNEIKRVGSIVVRLEVVKIKNGRRKTRVGTGLVFKVDKTYYIRTNNHVVKTQDDVQNCTVEFHYDSTDRTNVITSSGFFLLETDPYRDYTDFFFYPVPEFLHQIDFDGVGDVPYINFLDEYNEIVRFTTMPYSRNWISLCTFTHTLASHLNLNSSTMQTMFLTLPNGSIGYFKSCYFKFRPIPSNIQKFTSISIRIDENDGNSREISCEVVKFDDEFVVKISKSIFQDEVKKCRLVWNGKVLGRGTRLYFKNVGTKEFYSNQDIATDLERHLKDRPNGMWLFDYHPKVEVTIDLKRPEPGLTKDKRMCCIGHPHGGNKMVTFGHWLGDSDEYFDNRYRRIREPPKDCRCQRVTCMNYSCKTCQGSSGSPVIKLYGKLNHSIHSVHFMGERVERLPNGEMKENINKAWTPTKR